MTSLTVRILSFSYRDGCVADDPSGNGGGFVFDCRAIPNPGRDPAFKRLTGKGQEVRDFLDKRPEVEEFFSHVVALVDQAIENYKKRSFSHLMISFGCTGGQHRSVYFAERLGAYLKQKGVDVVIEHLQLPVIGL